MADGIRICLALFMGQMESSIVSTAILTITDDLGGYNQSVWIFTAYLLTYSGNGINADNLHTILTLCARLAHYLGQVERHLRQKTAANSGCCRLHRRFRSLWGEQDTYPAVRRLKTPLTFSTNCYISSIMFRWVQGIGGCGIYSIGTLLFFELVPPSKFADYTALVTAVVTFALAAGPLLGGAISDNTTWRWTFLLKYVTWERGLDGSTDSNSSSKYPCWSPFTSSISAIPTSQASKRTGGKCC